MLKTDDPTRRPFLSVLAEYAAGKHGIAGVEVGVAYGDNAAKMLEVASNLTSLWLIDPRGTYTQEGTEWDFGPCYPPVVQRFANNPRVQIIRDSSHAAVSRFADTSLDFAYLDLCHEEGATAEAIEDWLPRVKRGGYLAGHDFTYLWPGVPWAVLKAAHAHDWDLCTRIPDWWVRIE